MLTPGAESSTSGPRHDQLAIWSLELVAPTAITESYRAGYETWLQLIAVALPAAPT
jgi:hypothetical protein